MRRLLLAAALALLASTTVRAEDALGRAYALPKHGFFELKVPASWKDSVRQPPNELPPTLTFGARSGAPFQVLVTPIWKAHQDMKVPGPEEMRSSVERAAQEVSQQAVEKSILIKELQGSSGKGYYFFATDKAPKRGEFKYLTQGMLRVGDLAVTFTVLTNDGQERIVEDALSMLSGAVHKGAASPTSALRSIIDVNIPASRLPAGCNLANRWGQTTSVSAARVACGALNGADRRRCCQRGERV